MRGRERLSGAAVAVGKPVVWVEKRSGSKRKQRDALAEIPWESIAG